MSKLQALTQADQRCPHIVSNIARHLAQGTHQLFDAIKHRIHAPCEIIKFIAPIRDQRAACHVASTPLSAHDEIRVIGTILKPEASSLEVKTKDGQIVSIKLDNGTFISRDRKKADISELKVGGNVVIDAWGDSLADAVALEVRFVPSITAPASK